jgi:hypothetical protein
MHYNNRIRTPQQHRKTSNDMKEDIKEVLEQFKYGNYSIEQATNELFDLYNMPRSIEFAKYASTYYKVCYEKEPMWLNRNNHKRFTSSEVYENFIKYTNNCA